MKRRRQPSRNIIRAVLETTWLILPAKLEQITQFLEARAAGIELSREEIRAAFGADEDDDDDVRTVSGVRILSVMGVMSPRMNLLTRFSGGTSTQLVAQQLRAALQDPKVKAIVFEIDSPGGSAQGNQELADEIFAARGKKPIVAVVRGMAASAAYYVASAADKIIATPSSEVGSVGVLLVHSESSAAAEKAGVKYSIIQAGEFKTAGNPYTPLDAKSRGALQERVDAHYQQFLGAVARHRGVDAAVVEKQYGQGKVFLPDEALKRGMIDRVATLETVIAELAETPAAAQPPKENRSVNKRIKAALYALELVNAADAADDVCETSLAIFLKSIKATRPADDQGILDLLTKHFGGNVVKTDDQKPKPGELSEDQIKTEAAKAERLRIKDLEARRALLAESGLVITDEAYQAAVDNGLTVKDALDDWTKAAKKEPPASKDIRPSGSAADTFIAAATDALLDRFGLRAAGAPALSREARDCRGQRLVELAAFELRCRGQRVEGEKEDIASAWLKQGGMFSISSSHGSLQRAADFPHLLSNLAGKMLDQSLELAEATYPQWTARIQDAPDLKPHPVLAIGGFDELDRVGDDEAAKQLKLDEEMPAWFQVDRYANKAGLTAVMVANEDLDQFTQAMQSLSTAHENTLNRMCVALITGNVTLLDGFALFDDTNHTNDVTAGGAPSATEYDKMRKKHRAQRGIGGKGFVRTPPRILLVPAAHETAAETTAQPFASIGELKVPVTDATLNPFRGKLVPVVEPELDASSTTKWYTFANPAVRRVICHVFMSGYGRGGRRTSWFDPDAETRWFKLEGRMAAFAGGYRGGVRNSGTP